LAGLPVDAWGDVALNPVMRPLHLLLVFVFAGAAGCASKPQRAARPGSKPSSPDSTATPIRVLHGRVIAANVASQFVVIDFSPGGMPATGRRMNVFRQGQKVGEVKISGPARNFNIAADVLAGEAGVGDEVRDY
jgi:hypothetical protein